MSMRRNDWIRVGLVCGSIVADFALGRTGLLFMAALFGCMIWGYSDGEGGEK